MADSKSRKGISKRELLYIPNSNTTEPAWARPDQCVLEAPQEITHKYPLKALYGNDPHGDDLFRFFRQILSVHDASHSDIIAELEAMQEWEEVEISEVVAMYRYISQPRFAEYADEIRSVCEDVVNICDVTNIHIGKLSQLNSSYLARRTMSGIRLVTVCGYQALASQTKRA